MEVGWDQNVQLMCVQYFICTVMNFDYYFLVNGDLMNGDKLSLYTTIS